MDPSLGGSRFGRLDEVNITWIIGQSWQGAPAAVYLSLHAAFQFSAEQTKRRDSTAPALAAVEFHFWHGDAMSADKIGPRTYSTQAFWGGPDYSAV